MQTIKQAGYKYIQATSEIGSKRKLHVLQNGDLYEVWAANKNRASFGLKYKNTHLEFCYSIKENFV